MGRHVFVSYSRKDQAYTRELVEDLGQRGFDVWVDDRIDYGDRWWRTIDQAIRSCAALVVVMTPHSEKSDWVERELHLALREAKPIFPLLLRGKEFSLLITAQYADVTGGRMPPQDFYDRLTKALPTLGQMYDQAQAALSENRYDEAAGLLETIIKRDASYKDASRLLTEAVELKYRSVLEVDPQNLEARLGIASLLLETGDLLQTAEEYEKALETDPDDIAARSGFCQAHLALGDQLREKGEIEEALEHYRQVLSVDEQHLEARERLVAYHAQRGAQLRAEKRFDEAIEAFEQALELTPEGPAITEQLAEAQAARRANKLSTLGEIGDEHFGAERWDQAIASFEEYLSLVPEDEENAQAVDVRLAQAREQRELADMYDEAQAALSRKKYARAVRLFKEVNKRDEGHKDVARLLAETVDLQRQPRPLWRDIRVLGGTGGGIVVIVVFLLFSFFPRHAQVPTPTEPPALITHTPPLSTLTTPAPTPAPVESTSAATPTLPSQYEPEEIVALIAPAMEDVHSFHFELETSGATLYLDEAETTAFRAAEGDVLRPDSVDMLASVTIGELPITIRIVAVGRKRLMADALGREWVDVPFDLDILLSMFEEEGILHHEWKSQDMRLIGVEKTDGQLLYHFGGSAAGMDSYLQPIGVDTDGEVEIWADSIDFRLRKLQATGMGPGAEPTSFVIDLSAFDEPVQIQLPSATPAPTLAPAPPGMALIPAGEFRMGSRSTETARDGPLCEPEDDEKPPRTVHLDAFYIDIYEVANAQYRDCVKAGACNPPANTSSSTRDSYYGISQYDNYPVIYVSWYDA